MKFIPTDERNITDQDVFAALDLTLPQLAPIREALEKNDLPKAKEALIRHFETRTAPNTSLITGRFLWRKSIPIPVLVIFSVPWA